MAAHLLLTLEFLCENAKTLRELLDTDLQRIYIRTEGRIRVAGCFCCTLFGEFD